MNKRTLAQCMFKSGDRPNRLLFKLVSVIIPKERNRGVKMSPGLVEFFPLWETPFKRSETWCVVPVLHKKTSVPVSRVGTVRDWTLNCHKPLSRKSLH